MPEPSIYEYVFAQAPTGEYLLSATPEAIGLAVNEAFLQQASRTREELIGVSVFDAFPGNPDDPLDNGVDALRASIARVLATGRPDTLPAQRYPIRVVSPDGTRRYEERYWSSVNTPVFDADGRLLCISHRALDVTEKRRIEDALRRSTARQAYQLALADRLWPLTSPQDIVAAATEQLGRHLDIARVMYAELDPANRGFRVQRHWSRDPGDDLTGMAGRPDDFGPELIAELRMGRPVIINDVETDPRTRPHAAAYQALGVRSNLTLPLVKAGAMRLVLSLHDNRPRQWSEDDIELARDTAERSWSAAESARAQTAMRAERDLSQSIFNSMTEGFALLDADWTIEQMNVEGLRMVQRDAGDVIGQNHWAVFPTSVGTAVERMIRNVGATRVADTVEYEYPTPAGGHLWMDVRAYPVPDGRLAVFFRDISERKRFEADLQQAARRKDEFLAMLAHELRNPLAPISAAAELMATGGLDPERVRQTSQIIGRQVRHMTALVDDLLDVSRVTRGLVALERAHLDLKQVLSNAVEQARPLMEAQRHHLSIDLPAEAAHVYGDAKRLVQVFANLLNNASKYTPAGGEIHLRMVVDADAVSVEVRDNGVGIAPKLQPHVFDLFTQAERTLDRSQGGLGLGLALVKSLVELHGGTVACSSGGPGLGAAFTVALPRHVQLAPEPERACTGIAPAPRRALRLLVVDDNVDAAEMLRLLLETAGHAVTVEHDSQRALERALHDAPDAGLVDIGLPGMDGCELVRRLRAQPQTARAAWIAVTGYGQGQDRERALDAGFDEHLVKPVDAAALITLLDRVVDARAVERAPRQA